MERTGIILDSLFTQYRRQAGHPEAAERLQVIQEMLQEEGLLEEVVPFPLRQAKEEELRRFHKEEYLRHLEKTEVDYEIARYAVGALLNLTDGLLRGEVQRGLALLRPPGHHAEYDRELGYCLLNNVALAAFHALEVHQLERILIVDWDVHHGNGIEQAFYYDPRVLYCSIHRADLFPGTGELSSIGAGEGKGYNINVPLPTYGFGNDMYEAFLNRIVEPVALRYRPQLILVAAGFDCYFLDEIGMMRVTSEGYARLTGHLVELANELCEGRLLFALEGGYHLRGLARCVAYVLGVCLGLRTPMDNHLPLPATFPPLVEQLREHLAAYWPELGELRQEKQRSAFWDEGEVDFERMRLRFKKDKDKGDEWAELELEGTVLVRANIRRREAQVTIKFITVRDRFERRGLGRFFVERFQESHKEIIAQGVKYNARGFWQKLGFVPQKVSKDYRWSRAACDEKPNLPPTEEAVAG